MRGQLKPTQLETSWAFLNRHLRIFLLILDREEGGEREEERERDRLHPVYTLTGDQTRNLGMCPDQESNPQPFGAWDDAGARASWAFFYSHRGHAY